MSSHADYHSTIQLELAWWLGSIHAAMCCDSYSWRLSSPGFPVMLITMVEIVPNPRPSLGHVLRGHWGSAPEVAGLRIPTGVCHAEIPGKTGLDLKGRGIRRLQYHVCDAILPMDRSLGDEA